MDEIKLLGIDIGSNAMRASLFVRDKTNDLELLTSARYPLRLGEDSFFAGKISKKKLRRLEDAFSDLFEKLEQHKVDYKYAVATSAIRDAENQKEIISSIKNKFNIEIELISGIREASLITNAIATIYPLKDHLCLHIDIGGGSTEIILINKGEVTYSKSFQCGTVRLLEKQKSKDLEAEVNQFTEEVISDLNPFIENEQITLCTGTGGNLRRMGKLRKTFFNRNSRKIFQHELIAIKQEVKKFSLQQRMSFLNMRVDRADVIVPAMEIVEELLIKLDLPEIHLPSVGVKEGLIIEKVEPPIRNLLI